MPINVRRKYMYRKMSGIIEGVMMEAAQRKRLPACVEDGIREIFPDPDGLYMGWGTWITIKSKQKEHNS